MNDFKVGDRVMYTGNVSTKMVGKVGVVVQSPCPGTSMVFFDHGDDEPYGAYPESLTKLPAPDVITINRSDLPEVKRWGTGDLRIGYSTYAKGKSAAQHRQVAMEQLAIAEYLDAQAAAKRDAIIESLGHADLALRPIIALHSPTKWDECDGCDYSGYEGDKPDWPCRTIGLILEGITP